MVGPNDNLPRLNEEPGVDYVLFTDQDVKSDFWDIRPIPKEAYVNTRGDPRRISRYVKINPMKVFPLYSYSIYVDSNISLPWSVMSYLVELGTASIGVRMHPSRICAYEEARVVKQLRFDNEKDVDWTTNFLRSEGYPENIGLTENGLLVRAHDETNEKLSELWWDLYCKGSRRDQLSFNYCVWKLRVELMIFPQSSIRLYAHARNNREWKG